MLEWKEEWGEIGCYKASVIAKKLGCTIEQARALKQGNAAPRLVMVSICEQPTDPNCAIIESEADHGS